MTTSAPGSITSSGAVLGGNVTADGGATVTARGVVYSITSTNGTPTIGGSGVQQAVNGSGTGSFSATISSLAAGTSYSVQAYATNSVGTSYGGVQTFTTNAATVTAVTGRTPSPTATTQVTYTVTFSAPVSGVTASNFSLTTTGLSGAGIASVSPTTGTSAAYTVVVNTSTGDGTLQLNVANATGITPTISNVPYTSGTTYTITKSFAAAPTLRIQGAGSASGNGDVTAFVDAVQVLQSGTSTAVANGVQNGSFETNNVAAGNYLYQSQGVAASPWSFGTQAGISRNNSAFGSTAADGDAVAFLQSAAGNNGNVSQNLAVPTGSYQVRFRALQRNYTSLDQRLNVFVNDVFVGNIQPNNIPTYDTFTSAAFSVTAPALTATVSTTSASPTSTTPIPFAVSFSQSVGSTFVAADVTVSGGTLTSGSFSGSGSGPYTFTVTPSGAGTVTVSLAANVAQDANNTGNSASNAVSVQFQTRTPTPTLTSPVNGNTYNGSPIFTGTTQPNATVTLYLNGSGVSFSADGNGNFAVQFASPLASGTYTTYITAQASGQSVSNQSPTVTFTVDNTRPTPTVSTTSASPTSTAPIPFTVTFSEAVTGFTSSDVTVTNGTVTSFSNSGTSYNLTIAPTGSGTVTVSVPANVAQDGVGNQNVASNSVSVQYNQQVTAIPVLRQPADGSFVRTNLPEYTGTAVANSFIYIYRGGVLTDTTITNARGNFHKFSDANLADGTYAVYVTATTSGQATSANSNTNSFTVDTTPPTVTLSSSTVANGGATSTSPVSFTATFSEPVVNFASTSILVNRGTVTSGPTQVGTTNAYTFQVTPSGAGSVVVQVLPGGARDRAGNNNTPSTSYSFTFQPSTVTLAPATLPSGTQGVAYSQTLTASGGTAPYGYAITAGTLPAGLTLTSNGTLSGTPTAAGTYNFTVTATDASGTPGPYSGSRSYSLTIAGPAIALSPATLPDGTVGVAYSQTFTASGGTSPYSYAITAGALPPGMSLASNGSFSGTPTAGGSFTFTVTATDASTGSGPYSGSRTYTFTANSPSIVVAPTTLPNGTQGVAYSQTLTASGGTAPYSFGVVSGTLPAGLTLANSGQLSGTPTASGTFNFTVRATDASTGTGPYSGDRAYSFTIATQPVTAAPVVTAPADGSVLSTATPTYSGTAPAGSTVTVLVDGNSIGTATATGGTFALTQPTALSQGSHTVRATAQSSGLATSASSATNTFTVDTVAPTVTINSTAGASGSTTNSTPIPFTVTFSESVTGFAAAKVTVTNGTLSGFTAVSGTTYTFNVTPTTAGTATTVTVAANQAQDAAGNGNTAATAAYSLTYVAPITSVTWTGNTSTDWFTASNWLPNRVPDATIDATIPTAPSGNRFPAISAGTANVRNLTLNSGSTLTQGGGTVAIAADLTNNGNFQPAGGTTALGNTAQSSIRGSSSTRFWDLTIGSNGAQQSTPASMSVQRLLTLGGNLATNGNPFTLESSAAGTALVVNSGNSVVTGDVTVQRYLDPTLNPGPGYRHYAAPVRTATVARLATASYTPVVNPAYNTSATPARERPFPTVLGYDQARLASTSNDLDSFTKGWYSPASLSDALAVGQGYAVNLSAGQAFSVSGPLNNGDLSQTLSRNSGPTAAEAGLALVGNPYPAPLDWSQVTTTDRPNVDGVLYVFQSTSQYGGQYRSYVNGVGDPVVAQGQGFFVRVTPGQTSGQLTFRNAQRLTTYQNPALQRTAETRPLVQLTLRGAATPYQDQATVYFQAGASAGLDAEFDAPKLANSTGLNLSTSLAGASQQLSIDGRPVLGPAQLVVPLAVGVPAPGSYSLTAAQLLNLRTTPTYLRDLQTGTLVDLAQQPIYSFTVSNASSLLTGRFELVFAPQQALAASPAALAQQVALYPNPATGTAYVELPASLGRQAVAAVLVDAVGRQVRALTLPAQGAVAHQLDLRELPTGIYTLHLRTSAGTLVKKLTVE